MGGSLICVAAFLSLVGASPTSDSGAVEGSRRTYTGTELDSPWLYVAYTRSGTSVVEALSYLYSYTPHPATTTSITESTITSPPTSIDSYWTSPHWFDPPPTTPPCLNTTVLQRSKWTNATLPWPTPYYSSLLCCDELHSSWTKNSGIQSRLWQSEFITEWRTPKVLTSHVTRAVCSGPFTTLCDGVTRAMCSPSAPMPMELLDYPQDEWTTQSTKVPATGFSYPEPPPQCKVADSDCTRLWEDRLSFQTSITNPIGYFDLGGPEPEPEFQPPTPNCLVKQFDSCEYCMFKAAAVDFLHWDEEADESHLCPTNNTLTVSKSITSEELKTAQWKGFTLTSPTPYVLFRDMTHEGGCGSPHTSILFPVLRDQVSSMAAITGQQADLTAVKLNYKDLAYTTIGTHRVPLVPHSSYLDDQKCNRLGDECNTVYDDYQPVILFRLYPGEIEKVEPAWKWCDRQQFMARDPPIALTPTAVMAKPIISPVMAASRTAAIGEASNGPESSIRDGLVYPGVIPGRPYVVQTGSAQPPPQGQFNPQAVEGGSIPQPNDDPAVIVSKISLLTVYASPAGAHQKPGLTPVASDPYFGAQSSFPDGLKSAKGAPQAKVTSPPRPEDGPRIEAVFTNAGKTYTATSVSPEKFVLDGSTFSVGGSRVTINGAIVSAVDGGIVVQTRSGQLGSSLLPFQVGTSVVGYGSFGEGNRTTVITPAGSGNAVTTTKRKKNGGRREAAIHRYAFMLGTTTLAILLSS